MSEQKVWTMVTRLEYLAAGGEPNDRELGICADVSWMSKDYNLYVLSQALRDHPKATLNQIYPIPGPVTDDPVASFQEADDLWVGSYGKLRRDFAAHAAAYLKERGYE